MDVFSQRGKTSSFNPIPTEGGPFGPEQPKTVWHFHSFMAGVTKIHDFVYFSTCLVPVKLFLKKKLRNLEKLNKIFSLFWHQRVLSFGKKLKKIKIYYFFAKIHTFFTWIWIVHVPIFPLRYNEEQTKRPIRTFPYVNEVTLRGQNPPLKCC